jgi:hypothetical protein
MYFFSTDKDLFIAGICMMVPFGLRLAAGQCPDLLIAGVIVDMFLKLTYQIPVCIIAPILRRVLVLPALTGKLRFYRITAVIVVMAVTLLLPADKLCFIAAVAVLVFFYTA